MARKLYRVSLDKPLARKLKAPVKRKLAAHGLYCEIRKKRVKRLHKGDIPWSYVEHLFLVYSIGKEVGLWQTIRQILSDAGFSRQEIITLGLSQQIKSQQKQRRAKRTVKQS